MSSNGSNHLLFGALTQSGYETSGPISVDTSSHLRQANSSGAVFNGYNRGYGRGGSLRWNQAGISTSAERRLPFVHRFHDLPPPAGPARANLGAAAAAAAGRQKAAKTSTYETNPVGALQERFQSRGINPVYQVVQAEGASHCPTFTYQVFIHDLMATGSGSSKKQAKHAAARAMLDKLDGKESSTAAISAVPGTAAEFGTPVSGSTTPVSITVAAQVASGQIPSAVAVTDPSLTTSNDATTDVASSNNSKNGNNENSNSTNPVGLLQEFSVKHGLPMPVYELGGVEGQPHQRSFQVICKVGFVSESGQGSSKKEAKRKSATIMLTTLKDSGNGLQELVFNGGSATSTKNKGGITPESELSKRLQDLYLDSSSSKLSELQRTSLKNKSGDYVQMLNSIGQDQKFEVTFVEFDDERTDSNDIQALVQLSTNPVVVCCGVGKDNNSAKIDAARTALNYIKVMIGRSSGKNLLHSNESNKASSNSQPQQQLEDKTKKNPQNGHRK